MKSILNKIKLAYPTSDLKKTLEKYEIFDCKKLFFLPDAIIRIDELRRKTNFYR